MNILRSQNEVKTRIDQLFFTALRLNQSQIRYRKEKYYR